MGISLQDSTITPTHLATAVLNKTALDRFRVIKPFLDGDTRLTEIARVSNTPLRTVRRWTKRYREEGMSGLAPKARSQKKGSPIEQIIEGLALKKPKMSTAAIHRHVSVIAQQRNFRTPSYSTVHRVVRRISPALLSMAHDGTKVYGETFDLLYRTEAEAPNAIWQADHTLLDIWIIDDKGKPKKPWLTIILDDYSRAVAGYAISFSAPSAIQTALALRQAIWRKPQAGWQICGIPQILYTDHGSDFTSEHLEQVSADLRIQLIFSAVGKPRGRGKIERIFGTINQMFLSRLPGYSPAAANARAVLTLSDLTRELEGYLIREYNVTPHSTTKQSPNARWESGGFVPQMPASLEQLDLLLLTVAKERRIQQDGIQFMGMRYIDPTLAAYVGEKVILRFDPRDVAEIRVFYRDKFLCRAICQELAGETVALREIVNARNRRRRELRQTLDDRRHAVDALWETKRWAVSEIIPQEALPKPSTPTTPRLKRYQNE